MLKNIFIPCFRNLNQRGQGLIEYLILVALMGVATISVVSALNQAVKTKFASSIYAIQGVKKKAAIETLDEKEYQQSDLSDFMNGAVKGRWKSEE